MFRNFVSRTVARSCRWNTSGIFPKATVSLGNLSVRRFTNRARLRDTWNARRDMEGRRLSGELQAFRPSLSTAAPKLVVRSPVRTYAQRYEYRRFGRAQQWAHLWRTSANFRLGVYAVGGGGVLFYATHLEQVPVTGRWRFNCVKPETAASMGAGAYQATLQEFRGQILPEGAPETQMARRVLERLVPASGLDGKWELHVVASKEPNAFVIPGNKVFVMTGILPFCQNEDGLATVLGHEIAHNVAQHTAEGLSRFIPLTVAAWALGLAFGVDTGLPRLVLDLVLEWPGSRQQESEADHIGLLMMASSCFDPREALKFWRRMENYQKSKIPQFLSTHPSDRNRVKRLEEWLPQALDRQAQSECVSMIEYANRFRTAAESVGTMFT